ncbi:MAG: LEA type 2 family protein [Alistipes sp.]|nr:LEA type 2 family protein [Alistipes sp.]
MKKLQIIIITLVALIAASCTPKKIVNQMQENISVVAIENITGSISGGWVITLRVENSTPYQPTLQTAEGDIYVDNTLTAHASLMAPVTLPKKNISSIDIPLELNIHNPLKALSLVLRLSEKNFDNVDLTLNATVEMMGIKKSFAIEKSSANDILKKLGYTAQ